MSLISARPRLLPPTIVVMAALLGVKSVALVRAAIPSDAGVASVTATVPVSAPKPAVPPPPAPAPVPAAVSPAQVAATVPDVASPGCPPQPTPAAAPISDSERALLVDLRARRSELDARDAALSARVAVQDAVEKRLAERANELTALQQRLESLETARHDRDEANWRGLVISDWNMQPMTGLELLQEVRADARLKTLPFIMITAESKTENVIAAKRAGVSNYIVKPFNAETLRDKIEKVLGHA